MADPSSDWSCPKCGAAVDAGFETCWACGTGSDGVPDPDFKAADAPIVEADHVNPPPPWLAALLVLFPPALLIYALTKLLFPLKQRRFQFTLRFLLLLTLVVALALACWRWVLGPQATP